MGAYPIAPPIYPMLAKLGDRIPQGEGWLYEPKWDGFRAMVFRDGDDIHIASRNARPLGRYFPEVSAALARSLPQRCVVDGEIVIAGEGGLDFDALLQRIHPAASRVAMLAETSPASLIAFDLPALEQDLRQEPLSTRRRLLEQSLKSSDQIFITPQTSDPDVARSWFEKFEGAGLDGIIAKQATLKYHPGERVMIKIKHERTADCVVGGYRRSKDGGGVGSLLLGLYDRDGALHYVGHTSSLSASDRKRLLESLRPYEGGGGFAEGRVPGGPSRWNRGREAPWVSLESRLVCEVAFDHLQGDRFRHGTRFLRFRSDKEPRECTFDQLVAPRPFSLQRIKDLGP